MPGKEGPFVKKPAEDEGDYLQRYGTEPCIEVGLVREFQVRRRNHAFEPQGGSNFGGFDIHLCTSVASRATAGG
jgi:hypothetical protein